MTDEEIEELLLLLIRFVSGRELMGHKERERIWEFQKLLERLQS